MTERLRVRMKDSEPRPKTWLDLRTEIRRLVQLSNEAMLREGHAWAYRRYMREARFCDLEAEARDKKLGLWAQPVSEWIYPPEWRFLKNGEIRTLPAPYEETREKCVAVLGLAGAATY